VVEVCEEHGISGRADESDRHGLKRVEELAEAGEVKKVLVHEVSRLARKNSIVHRFVEHLEELGVSLYWHAQGVETLMASGKRNPAASIMLALLAEMARNEVETLSTRIKSGLEEAKRKGRKRVMRSVAGVPEMVNALQQISEDAADVLNTFLNHLERTLSDAVIPWQPSATDFLFKVAQHSKTATANQVIVRSLITEGAVSRTKALTPSIDALRREGVLERVANRQGVQSTTFAPTPAYRAAVYYLAEIADVSRLTVAMRQRTPP